MIFYVKPLFINLSTIQMNMATLAQPRQVAVGEDQSEPFEMCTRQWREVVQCEQI